jgi:hypothetical protein
MHKTITIAAFSFPNPAHFITGSQIIAMVKECCEGLFGPEQFRSACTCHIGTDPLRIGISTDEPEGQAMARILRHVLAMQLKSDIWTEETVIIDAFNVQQSWGRVS